MTTTSELGLNDLALGESTLIEASTQLTATDGEVIDSATAEATTTAIATDDSLALATTGLDSSVSADGGDGSGAAVSTETTAIAIATDGTALSTSTAESFAISTPEVDVAVGRTYSYASGDAYQSADASVESSGDITAGGGAEIDTSLVDAAVAVGVAVELSGSPFD